MGGLGGAGGSAQTAPGDPAGNQTIPEKDLSRPDAGRPGQRLGGGDSLGLRFNRSRRFLGVGSRRRDLTPGCRLRLGAPLLRWALFVFRDFWKGSTSFGLRWFAALTLARPKAPHIARRALSVSPGGHVHRPAPYSNASFAAELQSIFEPRRALFLLWDVTSLPAEKQRMLERLHGSDEGLAGKTVLLVDDDARNMFALSSVLERRAMRVLTATTGSEAIALLDANPGVAIVLTDIMMPEMDGYETIRLIRSNPLFGRLPIVALTAKTMRATGNNVRSPRIRLPGQACQHGTAVDDTTAMASPVGGVS